MASSVDVIPYALPFKEPYTTARGTLAQREMVLLRIRDSDGVEGLGEAVPLSLRGGDSLAEVTAELRAWAEYGDGADAAGGGSQGSWPPLGPPARCAVGTAIYDRAARRLGRPLWNLFGAGEAAPVRCNATLTANQPVHVAQQALAWEADGFGTFKLKLGSDPETDVESVQLAREALGPGARIRVDANGVWDLATATRVLAELEPLDIELAEQPVATLEEMAELRRATTIPLAADESIAGARDARRAVELGACDYATVKLSKIGSTRATLISAHLPVYISSALDGPVGIAAAAHAALILAAGDGDAGIAHGLATQRLFSATIASTACELDGDLLRIPDGPGLGVEIDEAALRRHRL
jgi:o-succinylbenzoate synthase